MSEQYATIEDLNNVIANMKQIQTDLENNILSVEENVNNNILGVQSDLQANIDNLDNQINKK